MKALLTYIILSVLIFQPPKYKSFGEKIDENNFITTKEFLSLVNTDGQNFKVKGVVEEVCQMKGCWMTLKNDQGMNVRVTFKGYSFFVPKDISGKEVIVQGFASKELLSEELARHYAEDGGDEYNDRDRSQISFEASGVLVAINS